MGTSLTLGKALIMEQVHPAESLVEGGGVFQPLPGIDYMAASPWLTLGEGQVSIDLGLQLVAPI